ncbi:MAG: pseudouridine synthase [Pseudobdellovibrio sp.]
MTSELLVRLSKLMSERGICSRREADVYIAKGYVSVDGKVVTELGTKVSPDCKITLSAQAMTQQNNLITIMLNKPVGYVSSQPEPGYEPAIRLITQDNQYKKHPTSKQSLKMGDLKNIAVTGRLDIDSQGLLLFTQDGRIAKKIIGENSHIEKEYLVRVKYLGSEKSLPHDKLKLLNYGLELDGEKLKPAKVEWINEDQLKFILTEGKKRQIRRMCELVNLKVLGLKRVRVGKLKLGDLPEGQWRFITDKEDI